MRFIVAFLLAFTLATDVLATPSGYKVSASSVIFSNSTKAKRYYGKSIHRRVRVASTTKVMTALLVLERLPLNKVVRVSRKATLPQPSKIYVKAGERYTVKNLLYALILESANDAAVVLAEAVSGSEEKFAQEMNARARKLGAKHTKFINASGLPQGKRSQYSTAYDMYLIFRQAIKNPFFRQAIKLKSKTIYSRTGRKIKLSSHNKLLFKNWRQAIYGKTGWTRRAKQCFLGYIMKGDEVCIIAIFGASRRWDDIRHIISRYGGIAL